MNLNQLKELIKETEDINELHQIANDLSKQDITIKEHGELSRLIAAQYSEITQEFQGC